MRTERSLSVRSVSALFMYLFFAARAQRRKIVVSRLFPCTRITRPLIESTPSSSRHNRGGLTQGATVNGGSIEKASALDSRRSTRAERVRQTEADRVDTFSAVPLPSVPRKMLIYYECLPQLVDNFSPGGASHVMNDSLQRHGDVNLRWSLLAGSFLQRKKKSTLGRPAPNSEPRLSAQMKLQKRRRNIDFFEIS